MFTETGGADFPVGQEFLACREELVPNTGSLEARSLPTPGTWLGPSVVTDLRLPRSAQPWIGMRDHGASRTWLHSPLPRSLCRGSTNGGRSCWTVAQRIGRLTPKYSWTTTLRIPRMSAQGTRGADA